MAKRILKTVTYNDATIAAGLETLNNNENITNIVDILTYYDQWLPGVRHDIIYGELV